MKYHKICLSNKIVTYESDCYVVILDEKEWPIIPDWSKDDEWLDRPIRRWVHEYCPDASFCFYGKIYFYNEEQFTQFYLTWG